MKSTIRVTERPVAHLIKPNADLMRCSASSSQAAFRWRRSTCSLAGCGPRWLPHRLELQLVFGAQVSGTGSGPSLYQVRPAAGVDLLWSGGAFGPEASVASVVAAWRLHRSPATSVVTNSKQFRRYQ